MENVFKFKIEKINFPKGNNAFDNLTKNEVIQNIIALVCRDYPTDKLQDVIRILQTQFRMYSLYTKVGAEESIYNSWEDGVVTIEIYRETSKEEFEDTALEIQRDALKALDPIIVLLSTQKPDLIAATEDTIEDITFAVRQSLDNYEDSIFDYWRLLWCKHHSESLLPETSND